MWQKPSWLIATIFIIAASSARAQQAKKIWRIGYLSITNPATEAARAKRIGLALRERGYIEGQNIAFEFRYGQGKRDRYSELAAELVSTKVDLILVVGGDATIRAAKSATKTIPIILTGPGSDPVAAGHVESLARPGGNVTGVTSLSRDLGGKRLELLKEIVPKLSRVGALYEPNNPAARHDLKEVLPTAARALQLTLEPWEVRGSSDFDRVLTAMGKQRPDGLYVIGGGLMFANQDRIIGFAFKHRLASLFSSRESVDAGGLMYYGANPAEQDRRIAYYIDRILTGTKPEVLPVERPMKFDFVINLKTAQQIGLTIPQWTLMKADRVIR